MDFEFFSLKSHGIYIFRRCRNPALISFQFILTNNAHGECMTFVLATIAPVTNTK